MTSAQDESSRLFRRFIRILFRRNFFFARLTDETRFKPGWRGGKRKGVQCERFVIGRHELDELNSIDHKRSSESDFFRRSAF